MSAAVRPSVQGTRALPAGWLAPGWAGAAVGAAMSPRSGGVSAAPWESLNLGDHVGDDAVHVAGNRRLLAEVTGARPVYLRQVHGTRVVRLTSADLAPDAPVHDADASVTDEPGLACTILVADCLPVVLAAPGGRAVGAAHAGWRGLAAGVIEACAEAVCELGACRPAQLNAWIGVGIGPRHFEVGPEVVRALGGDPDAGAPEGAGQQAFIRDEATRRWHADLPRLAGQRLRSLGIGQVETAAGCSAGEPSRFFSYRRDGVTGRMAACVWIRVHG